MRVFKPVLLILPCLLAWTLVSAEQNPTTQPSANITPPTDEDLVANSVVPFLSDNCYACHNEQRQAGHVNLRELNSMNSISQRRDTWDKVLKLVQNGEMPPHELPADEIPPGGIPDPSLDDREAAVKNIKAAINKIDQSVKPIAGRVSARRLNRAEYNNTVQDLLGVKLWPATDFPQDDAAYGFDNVADALTISPVLMEKYMGAAEQVARAAVFGVEQMPVSVAKLEQLERSVTNITVVPKEYDETGLTTDRALHAIHHFPADGTYLFRVTARGFRPLGSEDLELGLWLDGKFVTELKVDPKEDGPSLLGGRQDLFGKPQDYKMFVTAGDHWVAASVLRIYEGLPPAYHGPHPSTRKASTQPVEVALQQAEREKLDQAATQPGVEVAVVTADAAAPQAAPASQPTAGGRRGGRRGGRGGRGGLAPIETQVGIDYVDVIGPFDQVRKPSPESQALLYPRENMDRNDPNTPRDILAPLVARALRRPVSDTEVEPYLKLFKMVRDGGDSFEEALAVAIQGVLVSPDFLLRIERDPPAGSPAGEYSITDHELATRIAYFLWSTMPDAELREAADQGKLRDPQILEAQVRRMLKDPRSHALTENFGGQWLRFRALESVTPDFNLFPEFDAYMQISMKQETEMFIDFIIHEDRSVLDFIDGNYTFVNEKLARFYGIPGIKGPEFRKVDLTGSPRGGVITQGSVLTVSSYATRTSPVLRGKWLLENILNAPPPDPPPGIPALDVTIKNNPNATVRQQLEIHRSNPTCAGCHARMDPLGMGLENFNAIGGWRTQDGTHPVDASGKLPDGRSFNGPAELRQILKADHDAFVECLAEKLMTYAIGRGIETSDRPTLTKIVEKVSQDDDRFSRLVLEIVNSVPFRQRTAGSTP